MIRNMPEQKCPTIHDIPAKRPTIPADEPAIERDPDSLYEDMSMPPEKRNRIAEERSVKSGS